MHIIGLLVVVTLLSALLIAIPKSPWFKGKLGEFQITLLFKLFLPKDQYTVLHNITLPTDNGTTQIDHIVV